MSVQSNPTGGLNQQGFDAQDYLRTLSIDDIMAQGHVVNNRENENWQDIEDDEDDFNEYLEEYD